MKKHLIFVAVILQNLLAASALAFSYDFVEIDYYSGEIEIENLDGSYKTQSLSLILSKKIGEQFFVYAHPRITWIDDKGKAGIASVDLEATVSEVAVGVGRFFSLAPMLDTYLAAGLAQSQTKSDVAVEVMGYRKLISEKDTQKTQRVEAGIRWLPFDSKNLELSSYAALLFNQREDSIFGVAAAFNLVPGTQLKLLMDVIPDQIDDSLSLGAGVRASF